MRSLYVLVMLLLASPAFAATEIGTGSIITDACNNPDYGYAGCKNTPPFNNCCAAGPSDCILGWTSYSAGHNYDLACVPGDPNQANQCNTYDEEAHGGCVPNPVTGVPCKVYDSLCMPDPAVCGNSYCTPNEDCTTCPADCGNCGGEGPPVGGGGITIDVDVEHVPSAISPSSTNDFTATITWDPEAIYNTDEIVFTMRDRFNGITDSEVFYDEMAHAFIGLGSPITLTVPLTANHLGPWTVTVSAALGMGGPGTATTASDSYTVSILSSTCGAATTTQSCSGLTGTDAGYYCSDGINTDDGIATNGYCCAAGDAWDGSGCINTDECYVNPCPYLPSDSRFFTTGACVSTSANAGSPGACCSVGPKYGLPNYYDYSDATGNTANNFQIY